ncbi:TonB-dependent receptor [Filimonas effusa]|uniref:TonB-dependent receptor n=1 Tax=Filimonas effusa TaxID=2508721 RepID=A0A4Q1D1Q8_9BACT|nr:TonB-dependent receptor [Filimonas effusa]RXK81796.1 TonB-dependent receptor [Filimonas effusa]
MKKVIGIFLLCCISLIGFAQNGLVTGTVADEQQKLSLPGATIRLKPGNRYTISDEHGKFEFLNVPQGKYTLEVNYIGFKNGSYPVTVAPGKAASVRLLLEDGAVAGKEVVVLSDRLRGQAKALNRQKSNPNITNIVSADQVGRFPDANIGDAIKRIPGITMQNDQGEARNIIIRGLAPELNSVTLNGDRIPSAEGDNRRVQMDLIPSDMIQTIEVNKTLTSDMDADAIGGSVNLVTRAAPGGLRVSGTLAGGYSPIREKPIYTGALVVGNRFFNNKLGMVLSASYNSNDFGSDNVEGVWSKDKAGHVYMSEQDIRKYDVKRVRRSGSAAFDYKINDKNSIAFNAMYNWRDDWENRYRVRTRKIETVLDANNNITGYKGAIRRQTKGGADFGRSDNARLETQRVQNYSLRGDHLLGNAIAMDWAASYSTASEKRPHERYIEYEAKSQVLTEDLSDPAFPLVSTPAAVPLSAFGMNALSEQYGFTKEGEFGAKLNFRFPFSVVSGQKGRLRAGARLRVKDKKRENNFFEYSPVTPFGKLADMATVNWEGDKFQAGSKYIPGTFVSKQFLGSLDFTNPLLMKGEAVPSEYITINYKAKETITAGYVRWDQDLSSKLSMIAGVRLENTNTDYKGNIVEDEEDLKGQRDVKNSYLNVLPSLAFKYNVNQDFVLRAAATTSLARPNYYAIAPYVSILADDQAIDAGNSKLKASYAWNFDVMGEYYFKSVGLISGGVFYKNIRDFIYVYSNKQYTTENFAADYPGVTNPIPAGENWKYKQSQNGDNVNMYGFEVAVQRQLNFLPGVLKGLGVYVNYTYTKSNADGIYNGDGEKRENVALPGTAPHMFNASLSWENKRFVARLSGNYAAAYLDELGEDDFTDRYYDKQFFLDANASYKIGKYLRLFAEANNLTNQPLRYYQGVSNRTAQMEYYRSKFNLGIKFDLSK